MALQCGMLGRFTGYWWCSYRGYGLSEGSPTEAGLKQDTQAALDYLLMRKDVDPKKVLSSSTPCHGQRLDFDWISKQR